MGPIHFSTYTQSARRQGPHVDEADMKALEAFMAEHNFGKILGHAPYTLNACAADPSLRQFAKNMMREDLERLEFLPNQLYNFHPGSMSNKVLIRALNILWKPSMKSCLKACTLPYC